MVAVQSASLKAKRVSGPTDAILVPSADQWERAAEVEISLQPTPLDRQPSAYVQAAWEGRPRGSVRHVRVRALTAGDTLFLRLEWSVPRPHRSITDVNVYADACGVLFPADGLDADLVTMGSPSHPVVAWYWRAGAETPYSVVASGLGTVRRQSEHRLRARGEWTDGDWRVVLAHPLGKGSVPLARGSKVRLSFAVWSGAARERAGLKLHSPAWHELQVG